VRRRGPSRRRCDGTAVVRDATRVVIGALIVAAPSARLRIEGGVGRLVREEAATISRSLGYAWRNGTTEPDTLRQVDALRFVNPSCACPRAVMDRRRVLRRPERLWKGCGCVRVRCKAAIAWGHAVRAASTERLRSKRANWTGVQTLQRREGAARIGVERVPDVRSCLMSHVGALRNRRHPASRWLVAQLLAA